MLRAMVEIEVAVADTYDIWGRCSILKVANQRRVAMTTIGLRSSNIDGVDGFITFSKILHHDVHKNLLILIFL